MIFTFFELLHTFSRTLHYNFGTKRKPRCDFLLVNNTNLHLISHLLPDIAQIVAVIQSVPLCNERVVDNICEYRRKS